MMSEQGIGTISILFLLTLIWGITILTIQEINFTLSLRTAAISQIEANTLAKNEALNLLVQNSKENKSGFICNKSYKEYKKGGSLYTACILTNNFQQKQITGNSTAGIMNIDTTPIFNFDNYIESTTNCANVPITSLENSYFGTPLSISSSIWPYTCLALKSEFGMLETHLSNLALTQDSTIYAKPSSDPYYVVVTGYLETKSKLTIEGNTIIIAGGDIIIEHLIAKNFGSTQISLFSTTGSVLIRKIEGSPRLVTYGWLGSQIVGTYNEQLPPMLPKIYNHLPLSIGR